MVVVCVASMATPAAPTDYELYLRVPELLGLQKPPEQRACPDELLFQVVHQAAELWMKLIEQEMQRVIASISPPATADLARAGLLLRRVHRVQGVLLEGIEPLYTLSPSDYMRIRAVLGRGSGQESPGFRRLLALGGEIWPHVEALLAHRGCALREVYGDPAHHAELFALTEALLDFDLRLQEWRNRHILLVYRTIGVGTPSLKGKHSELLERGLRTQFFPALWAVRDEVFAAWSAGHPHGASYSLAKGPLPDADAALEPEPVPPAGSVAPRAPKPPRPAKPGA
jgi:tryptophan 2,3-dioxygenase